MSKTPSRSRHSSVIEAEFSLQGSKYPFVGVSETESCTFELAKILPRCGGEYSEFFNVTDVRPGRIMDAAAGNELVEVDLLNEYDDGGLFEFQVGTSCPAVTLAELGAHPREVHSSDGDGRIVAEIPPQNEPPEVIKAFLDEVPEAEFTGKRTKETITPLFTPEAIQQVLHSQLTDRQLELLEAAFEAGYYDWPRRCTGEELAEEFDISSATFSEHIHTAERRLLTVLFDGLNSP
ncbi:helix-turn-helix domain-containing protein [Natronomonas halophila]|uniref:helix-turn-helix domain-containing protein n=1 Tax=Natronomonas halophila TaxID=2747817 RepID=UPI0015B3A2F1|nr:bacterio-opsin activator domain-containing protein [Natronomonas halophila]QLD87393.1 helix-turn-helix domain-containing protein [Natronomonas halophila]